MTPDEFVANVRALLAAYDTPSAPPTLPSGGDLQALLESGATEISLEPGGLYAGVTISRPVRILGNGATLRGRGQPALYVRPGTTDVTVENAIYASDYQSHIQLGDNGPLQVSLAQVPQRIRLVHPVIQGPAKNAIENNATEVEIVDLAISDVYSASGVESHGIATINTPGRLRLIGGVVSGGSIGLFCGGDAIDIPNVDIENVLYDGLTITKPENWQGDSVNRNIKNLIEFKNASNVVVANCRLINSWGPIQRGFACMLTPKVDGHVTNVEFNNCDIIDVGAGFNITGRNPTGADPVRTDDIRILNNRITIDKIAFAGVGWPLLLQDGVGRVQVIGNSINHNGNALVYVDDVERIASLVIRGNFANVGTYGIRTPFGNNGDNWQQAFDELIVEDNTFSGASSVFRRNFPRNTYV